MSVTSTLRRDVSDAITQQASERSVSPGLTHVLSPKFISARARPLGKTENRSGRLILFVLVGAIFWVFVFGLLYRLLKYGPEPNYWNEFVFKAYHHHQAEAIFLAGIPDLKATLPHA